MNNELTIDSLLTQWYEETQKTRIDKGFIKVSMNDIYNKNLGIDCINRVITLKQVSLLKAMYFKKYKVMPIINEPIFINLKTDEYTEKTIIVSFNETYNRGSIYFKLPK